MTKKHFPACAGLFFIALVSCVPAGLPAQTSAAMDKSTFVGKDIKALRVGDRIPDLTFTNLLNYNGESIRLSDYTGKKMLILDFWATWCSACLHNFPKMDSLQKQYGDQLQILLINTINTRDTDAKIKAAFDRYTKRHGEGFSLPFINRDSITELLFPHRELPHYVWISKEGVIQAITNSDEISFSNVKGIIDGSLTKLKEKRDNMQFKSQEPLFINGNGGSGDNFKTRTILTGYNPELRGMSGVTPDEASLNAGKGVLYTRIFSFNAPILSLYKHAMPVITDWPANRMVFEVQDESRYHREGKWPEEWMQDNLYVYELIVPATKRENLQRYMLADLNRFFNLSVTVQERRTPYLALVKAGMPSASGPEELPENSLYEPDNKPKHIQNQPVAALVTRLNDLYSKPVLDETGFSKNVSLQLPADLSVLKELKSALKKYGFDLIEKEKVMPMCVFQELR